MSEVLDFGLINDKNLLSQTPAKKLDNGNLSFT